MGMESSTKRSALPCELASEAAETVREVKEDPAEEDPAEGDPVAARRLR